MSLGDFQHLPIELIRHVCYQMELQDVANFKACHAVLGSMIDNAFFTDFRSLTIVWLSQGATIYFSGPSVVEDYEISTKDDEWKEMLISARRINRISIIKMNDANDYEILKAIRHAGYDLKELEIKIQGQEIIKPKDEVNKPEVIRSNRKLSEFVKAHSHCLQRLRLDTDFESRVEMVIRGNEVIMHYAQKSNERKENEDDGEQSLQSFRYYMLIHPMFTSLVTDVEVNSLVLQVNWQGKMCLALQRAFQAALPLCNRAALQKLRLDFGATISTVTERELHRVLSTFTDYLTSAKKLQHITCDLTQSRLSTSSLLKLDSIIRDELSRCQLSALPTISLLVPPQKNDIESPLKKGRYNRVACW